MNPDPMWEVAALLPDALLLVNSHGEIEQANAPAASLFGLSPAQTCGRSLLELVTTPHEEVKRFLRLWAESPRMTTAGTLTLPGAGEEVVRYQAEGAMLRPQSPGTPARILLRLTTRESERFLSLSREISALNRELAERQRAEQELTRAALGREMQLASERDARKRAEDAHRLRDDFLAVVSHELRTPLTSVLGWIQLLRRLPADSPMKARALEAIEQNALAQARLIDDLLDASRLVAGRLHLRIRPVKPATFVTPAVEAVRHGAEAKGLRLDVTIDPALDVVSVDPERLQQMLWHLLSNAIKFTPPGGEVDLQLRRHPSNLEITVRDSGIGIAPDFLPYLFDRFRQAEDPTTRRFSGMGLGLAMVRHLAELHGGEVLAESPGENQGATFTIRLPIAPARATSVEPAAGERRPPRAESRVVEPSVLGGMRVVLVDDETPTRELLETVLRQWGAEVRGAASVPEALALIGDSAPQLLVSDISMPDADGLDLIREVRALPPAQGGTIPAIALTAYSRATDRTQALEAGYDIYLTKPVELGAFLDAIQRLIARGRTAPGSRRDS